LGSAGEDIKSRGSGERAQRAPEAPRPPPACYPANVTREPSLLAECAALQGALARFPTLRALRASPAWPELSARLARVLTTVRRHAPAAPPGPARDPGRVRVAQWNIEHGNGYEQVEQALLTHPELRDADVVSLNEVDLGMARAGNRDVAGDLAAALGRHGVWSALFLETTPGRDDDPRMAAGRANQEGLFGIALLSRWPIGAVRRVELPSPEEVQFDLERMVGRHVALVAIIERPGAPFTMVTVHLEVHRTRAYRAAQMRVLLESLADERRPVIIAGDFNSHTFDRGRPWDGLFGAAVLTLTPGRSLERRLLHPDRGHAREPLFDALAAAGFDWERTVDHAPTLQLRLDRLGETRTLFGPLAPAARRALAWAERRAALRLDWLAGRGWSGGRGLTISGLSGPGRASDHAPIVGELW
jgi:endonuclease/exonuclease/phosphatase family metal-dependent hydrolase